MSLKALFGKAIARLSRQRWGAQIPTSDGPRDTGVQALAEELAALLGDAGAIELKEPLTFVKKHTGPLFHVNYGAEDSSPLAKFYRDGQEVSSTVDTETGESSGTTRVTQNIASAVGSLYRVASIGDNGMVTLDVIDVTGTATGEQITARVPQ